MVATFGGDAMDDRVVGIGASAGPAFLEREDVRAEIETDLYHAVGTPQPLIPACTLNVATTMLSGVNRVHILRRD